MTTTVEATETLEYRDVSTLTPNPKNCRKVFDAGELQKLADSIVEEGLLQSLRVRADGTIISGERRKRAIDLAIKQRKLPKDYDVPCIVIEGADETKEQIDALIENLQRVDLDPMEEAWAYYSLIQVGQTQADLSKRVGRSTAHISKRLALLRLDEKVQKALTAGDITIDKALALASIEDQERQVVLLSKPDYQVAEEIQKQKTDKLIEKAKAELEGLGVEVALSMAAPPQGMDWEQVGEDVDFEKFKGKVPRGASTAYLITHTYNATVKVRFYKLIEVAGDSPKAPSASKAADQAAERAKKEAARTRAVNKAKQEAIGAAAARPKKADVLGWCLDSVLRGASQQPVNKVICDHLDLDVEVDEETTYDKKVRKVKNYTKAVKDFLAESEANRVKVALVILATSWGTSETVLKAIGFDERKVKVGA